MMTPLRCVVDTNVAVTANGGNEAATEACVAASARALQAVMMAGGHIFIDESGAILGEYRNNLPYSGDPRPGTAFLKWLLTNEWNPKRVSRVPLTPKKKDPQDFEELPLPPPGINYDPSDRKFLAVSAAHPLHPPVLQALDSKWWGWRAAFDQAQIVVSFLCPEEIARKYAEKTRR